MENQARRSVRHQPGTVTASGTAIMMALHLSHRAGPADHDGTRRRTQAPPGQQPVVVLVESSSTLDLEYGTGVPGRGAVRVVT
jgi:hypothetical protein